MKHFATAALMLNLGVASVYAQQHPVHMTFSGTAVPSTINLQPSALNSEYNFTGDGTLGQFTFRTLSVSVPSQQPPPPGCLLYGTTVAGAGVFRFQDGSLLMVTLTQGSDCVTPPSGALCIRTFVIKSGTGRFKDVSGGSLTLTETLVPVPGLADPSNNPVLFAVTGEATGTVSLH